MSQERYPVGFWFNTTNGQVNDGTIYEVINNTRSNYEVNNLVKNNSTTISDVVHYIRHYNQTDPRIVEHNAKLLKPNKLFELNTLVVTPNNYFYLVASKLDDEGNYICYSLRDKIYQKLHFRLLEEVKRENAIKVLATTCKVNQIEQSVFLFGFKSKKLKCLNNTYKFKVENGFVCKKDGVTRDTLLLNIDEGEWLRFVASECELIYNFPTIQEQKHKPDKTIRVNDEVRLVNNKKLPLERNAICKVNKIVPSNNTKYKIKGTSNRPLDVVHLECIKTGRKYPTYMKNLKKIINDK